MKLPFHETKLLLCCIGLFITTSLIAQNPQLWGTTENGGAYSGGTIFYMNADGTNFNVAYNFMDPEGNNPMGNLFMASDGNLYGTCMYGGNYASCTIYRYNPVSGDYSDVHDFQGIEGDFPTSGVIEKNGILYGNASSGGLNMVGVIYSYNLSTGVYTDIYDLTWETGGNPFSAPIIATDGKLYGTTEIGGANNGGTIYSFDPNNNTYTDVHDFGGNADPIGGLIQASDGKLYGMTFYGGPDDDGILFSFDPSDNSYEKLHHFNGTNGAHPQGALMQGSNGILYGLTTQGGTSNYGVIFSLDPFGNTFTKLFDFTISDGADPFGNLMQIGNILYGTTAGGGANSFGTVFNFDILTNTYTKLLDFDGSNGGTPSGGFITLGDGATGVHLPAEDEFTIYPNPVTQYAVCNAPSFNNQKVNVTLTDLSGKGILSQQLVMRNSQLKIDLGDFTSGIYFLELKAGDEKKIAKVVKQ